MRRHQTDARGNEVNIVEKSVDLAIGSGNHAVTFLNRTPQGRLLELPLSWYARSAVGGCLPAMTGPIMMTSGARSPTRVCFATQPVRLPPRSIAPAVMAMCKNISSRP